MTTNDLMMFWKDKKVWVSGHSGFKGGWLCLMLHQLGARVAGYSLPPNTSPSLFDVLQVDQWIESSEFGDIRNRQKVNTSLQQFNPDIIIHLAAQPLVSESYRDPVYTFDTNIMGTINILESAKKLKSLHSILVITTDKCYQNQEWIWGYRETDPLGGHDPYSSSKACVELVTQSYYHSFFKALNVKVATARAGNVIGGGDWSLNRLVPDLLRDFSNGTKTQIRSPNSIRPWQYVLEPLLGYLLLVQKSFNPAFTYSEAWNFGPFENNIKTVAYIADTLTQLLNSSGWLDKSDKNSFHETKILKLDSSKAVTKLAWSPTLSLDESLQMIADWHNAWQKDENLLEHSKQEIRAYLDRAFI